METVKQLDQNRKNGRKLPPIAKGGVLEPEQRVVCKEELI